MTFMELRQEVWKKAVKITGLFEGGTYASGNFDGQGLSMGLLQWNLGQGTLQPILLEVFSMYPASNWELQDLKVALDNGTALSFAKETLNGWGARLVEPWRTRLNQLNNSSEFVAISAKYCDSYKNQAIALCEKFGVTTDRGFCLCMDVSTQLWSVSSVSGVTVEDKLKSIANAAVAKANSQFKDDVYKRKMAIVQGQDLGRGWPADVTFDDESMYQQEIIEVKDVIVATSILLEKGVITGSAYWIKVTEVSNYVDALLKNAAYILINKSDKSGGVRATSVDQALQILVKKGVVSSPDYWLKAIGVIRYIDALLINIASAVSRK
jgi:hypothetical protein